MQVSSSWSTFVQIAEEVLDSQEELCSMELLNLFLCDMTYVLLKSSFRLDIHLS